MQKLLSLNNTKVLKSKEYGYLTAILHLAPYTLSGHNVCPMASKGCAMACLNTAGMGKFSNVQQSRINKTKLFYSDRPLFVNTLIKEIHSLNKKATNEGLKLAIRLNGTSDLRWESLTNVIQSFPDIPFYDYTKIKNRKGLPTNYSLTFSRSEDTTDEEVVDFVTNKGMNVAVVFGNKELPKHYLGLPVINGDEHDLRFLDPKGVIVGLSAKGKAKKDTSGFVVNYTE